MLSIKLFGLGGQGVVTAARLLVHAVSIYENRYGKTIPAYGHERRGAPVFADVFIDKEQVLLNSFVYEPDMVVLFAPSVIERGIAVEQGIHHDSILLVNCSDPAVVKQIREKPGFIFKEMYYVDATGAALEHIGRDIPSTAMLGAFASTGIVSINSIDSVLEEVFHHEQARKNRAAAHAAYERTRKI